jgi:hypothetical protein
LHVLPAGQTFPHWPQFAASSERSASQPSIGSLLQSANCSLHVKPHASFVQVARAFAGTGHTAHVGPHAVGSVRSTHVPLQARRAPVHVKVQTLASHAIVASFTAGHARLQAPQCITFEVGSTHSSPQSRGAAAVQPVVHSKVPPIGAQKGATGPQHALHAPQVGAFERSTSQPSAGCALQSAYPLLHEATTHAPP